MKAAPRSLARAVVATRGYNKCKNALDAKLNFDKPWRIHDIRRSVATHMAEIGILPHIVEATLNHLSGHKSGIAGVYNRATYDDERAAALDKWSSHVKHILAQAHWKSRAVDDYTSQDKSSPWLGLMCQQRFDTVLGAAFEPPFTSGTNGNNANKTIQAPWLWTACPAAGTRTTCVR